MNGLNLLRAAGSDVALARDLAAGVFGSQAFAGGVGGLFWDLLNGLNDRLSAQPAAAEVRASPRTGV